MKRTSILYSFLFAATAVTFMACNNKEKSSTTTAVSSEMSFDLAEAKKSIEAANIAFMDALKKNDSVAFANLYTRDAKIMAPNMPPAMGTDKIRGFAHQMGKMGIVDIRLKTVDVWGCSDALTEEGSWTLHDDKGVETDHGKYIVLWKQEEGKWKLFRDCWNSDTSPNIPKK